MKKPFLIMLVGVPGSGKSTFIKELKKHFEFEVISTDDHIENVAKLSGKTYSDVFSNAIKDATKKMWEDVNTHRFTMANVVWDQTNLSAVKRKEKLENFPDHLKISILFPTPQEYELDKRLKSRPGKFISNYIVDSMIKQLETPSKSEGFDFTFINNPIIMKSLKRIL